MSEFKGTKGKWILDYGFPDSAGIDIITEKGWTEESPWIAHVHKNHVGVKLKEGKANALLISKAPEMLDMLESVAAMFAKGQIITVDNVVKKREEIKQLIKEATEL